MIANKLLRCYGMPLKVGPSSLRGEAHLDGIEHPTAQVMEVTEAQPDGLEALTVSQLEHALDAAKRGLGVYQSLSNLNDVIGAEYGDRVIYVSSDIRN